MQMSLWKSVAIDYSQRAWSSSRKDGYKKSFYIVACRINTIFVVQAKNIGEENGFNVNCFLVLICTIKHFELYSWSSDACNRIGINLECSQKH